MDRDTRYRRHVNNLYEEAGKARSTMEAHWMASDVAASKGDYKTAYYELQSYIEWMRLAEQAFAVADAEQNGLY